jgi:hypothetical protein
MPIGLVSDLDLQRELDSFRSSRSSSSDSTSKLAEVRKEERESHGRSEGDMNVPDSLRKIIGEESVINGRQSALSLASDFGISPSSVSAYAKGATSTASYDSPKPSIINHINKSRQRASKKAGKVLAAALEAISQEKLDYTDAKDLSGIAKDMSVIIKNLEPQSDSRSDSEAKSPQFVIFAPTFRDERSFETIEVKE